MRRLGSKPVVISAVLITGAARGIGPKTVTRLAALGWTVGSSWAWAARQRSLCGRVNQRRGDPS